MDIEYWEMKKDYSPVAEFIFAEPAKAQAKIQKVVEFYQEEGLSLLGSQFLKKLHGYDIYELRIRYQKISYRIFFIIFNSISWLVHAFKKKSDATPQKEIDIAERRRQLIIQT